MQIGKISDGKIYHYTPMETFLDLILPHERLRFGSFSNSIDPFEKHFRGTGAEIVEELDIEAVTPLFQDFSEKYRDISKSKAHVLCFANSYDPLSRAFAWGFYSDKGWAQAAMWTHFANRGTGVCLEFDRDKLIASAKESLGENAILLSGDLVYPSSGDMWIREKNFRLTRTRETLEADVFGHVINFSTPIFFQKNSNWRYEQEFRLVALNNCGKDVYIPIRDCLTSIIVGSEASPVRQETLLWMLEAAGFNIPVLKVGWLHECTLSPVRESVGETDASNPKNPHLPAAPPASEHVHDRICCPIPREAPQGLEEDAIWRATGFRHWDRVIATGLARIAAERGYDFWAGIASKSSFRLAGDEPTWMNHYRLGKFYTQNLLDIYIYLPGQFGASEARIITRDPSLDTTIKNVSFPISGGDQGARDAVSMLFNEINISVALLIDMDIPGTSQEVSDEGANEGTAENLS